MILKKFNFEKIRLAKTDAEKKGFDNEKQVAYLIDFHYKDIESSIVMHDVRLDYNGRTAQIDHLIISHGFVFVIESKMYSGSLEIVSDSWVVDYGAKKISIPSPVKQNERHIKVLMDIFENENIFPASRYTPSCINAVVISNKTIINGQRPDEVVYADSFDDWEKKAKIKWLVKNSLKLFTFKEQMSADEVQASAKRLLVFDTLKSLTSEVVTASEQQTVKPSSLLQVNHLVIKNSNDDDLLKSLKILRSRLAAQYDVKMLHHIFDNRTLADFVAKKPQTKEEMLKISGVGQIKLERYGEGFLNEIKKYK